VPQSGRITTIKPGMTRSDLLRVFATEGGLAARTHRTYVLKQCPILRVDVEFSIAGNEANDKITESRSFTLTPSMSTKFLSIGPQT
jgi:hypothetical protein